MIFQEIDVILGYMPKRPVVRNPDHPVLPLQLLKQIDISWEVSDYLDLASIKTLALNTRSFHLFNVATSRVRELFATYFDNPFDFGLCLKASGALVSGSSVLPILHGAINVTWEPKDLDIVVLEHFAPVVEKFLRSHGYASLQLPESTGINSRFV
jgi:hypothetical protein